MYMVVVPQLEIIPILTLLYTLLYIFTIVKRNTLTKKNLKKTTTNSNNEQTNKTLQLRLGQRNNRNRNKKDNNKKSNNNNINSKHKPLHRMNITISSIMPWNVNIAKIRERNRKKNLLYSTFFAFCSACIVPH